MIRLLAILAAVVLTAAPAGAASLIKGVRTGEHVGLTRVVVDLSGEAEWNLFVLDDPFRVVIDIEDAAWQLEARPDPPRGLIRDMRYGRFAANTGRLVLETELPVLAERQFMLAPAAGQGHRLVIDLRPASDTEFRSARNEAVARLTSPPPARPAVRDLGAGVPPLPPPRPATRMTVVVDPGHGGVDPGALGVRGTHEKQVVLDVGRRLRDVLVATGRYRVVMTREDDRFISLRDRVEIARRARADLFVSLHADAAPRRSVGGAGVYTLSETASDKETEALARRENQSDLLAGMDIAGSADEVTNLILIDLVQRETMNNSARFARVAVDEIGRTIELRSNPHRFAGFRVLKAPDVPSVLVELGFLSNPDEERKLISRDWQDRVARALTEAIDAYFRLRQK
ncbi:N-acetylmuramoyl-L-alanine amidase [Minwuia thermotolerans]|uniref:N-acetylmuramoyl-L-alanine amidase n=1 Tax=Minwuia thermotolerans TaxID=2056226 RepID=A0A2M9G3V0_9PROT|nr:N-acetylmuramoyl-L-alanine amidase [Minwuia thermotolerans]PJK30395.1 N-acetylmuramoyl-L-alanine amidase [Minwuia thermotolerans]